MQRWDGKFVNSESLYQDNLILMNSYIKQLQWSLNQILCYLLILYFLPILCIKTNFCYGQFSDWFEAIHLSDNKEITLHGKENPSQSKAMLILHIICIKLTVTMAFLGLFTASFLSDSCIKQGDHSSGK